MKTAHQFRLVFVTAPDLKTARSLAKAALEAKLAACANIVSRVESIYRWKGKVERAREVLVIMKTTATRLRELEREMKRLHSYDVPEFIVLPIVAGSQEYLKWIQDNAA